MKTKVQLLLRLTATYVGQRGVESSWDFYAKLYPSGLLRVLDPAFPAYKCEKSHYFNRRVSTTITNKGNRYFDLMSIIYEFANVAIQECFFPFKELHFKYKDPYVPQITLKVKMDRNLYEKPVQIKADFDGQWISVDSANKHLTVHADRYDRHLNDEF